MDKEGNHDTGTLWHMVATMMLAKWKLQRKSDEEYSDVRSSKLRFRPKSKVMRLPEWGHMGEWWHQQSGDSKGSQMKKMVMSLIPC